MMGKSYEEVMEECEKLLDGPLLNCSREQSDHANLWTFGQNTQALGHKSSWSLFCFKCKKYCSVEFEGSGIVAY